MDINHISVSRKQVWDLCQYQYRYKYHLKIVQDGPEPVYFAYGKIIHKIAQEYVAGKGVQPILEIANDVLTGKIEIEKGKQAPGLPQEYKRKIPGHLKTIHKFTEQTGFEGEQEYNFNFDLDPPHKRCVYGFIDRIIQKGNKFWIVDYKTTKQGWWRKGRKEITTDLQLRCYARIVQKDFGAKAEDIKAALLYLDGDELVGAQFSQESLDQVERELLETYLAIENTHHDKAKANVGQHCSRCDYKNICPFFKSGDEYLKKLGLD